MPYTILVHAFRKSGTSTSAFKAAYNAHVDLVKTLVGPAFPLVHERYYLRRSESTTEKEGAPTGGSGPSNAQTPAVAVLRGAQEDFEHDATALLTFADEAAFGRFMAKVQEPAVAPLIEADEERFLDRAKLRVAVIGELARTSGD